ncbi:hypothetical protein MSPP1_001961 [Malassezia sp. CBS 17886]|nr:hypothetical protein MSPP1_001961 [Malassezia sp. CBS 17886]
MRSSYGPEVPPETVLGAVPTAPRSIFADGVNPRELYGAPQTRAPGADDVFKSAPVTERRESRVYDDDSDDDDADVPPAVPPKEEHERTPVRATSLDASAPTVFSLNYSTAERHVPEYLYNIGNYDENVIPTSHVASLPVAAYLGESVGSDTRGEDKGKGKQADESIVIKDSDEDITEEVSESDVAESETKEKEAKEREAQEKEAKEREAKEKEAKEKEAKEREAREKEAQEKEAREREAKEKEAKEREVREREAKEKEAKEKEAREKETKEREAKEKQAAEEEAAKEKAAKKKAEKEETVKEETAKEEAAKEEAAKEEAAKEEAAKEEAAKEEAAKEEAAKEAAKEKAEKEAAAREKAAKEKAAKEAADKRLAEETTAREAAEKKAAQEAADKKSADEAAAKKATKEPILKSTTTPSSSTAGKAAPALVDAQVLGMAPAISTSGSQAHFATPPTKNSASVTTDKGAREGTGNLPSYLTSSLSASTLPSYLRGDALATASARAEQSGDIPRSQTSAALPKATLSQPSSVRTSAPSQRNISASSSYSAYRDGRPAPALKHGFASLLHMTPEQAAELQATREQPKDEVSARDVKKVGMESSAPSVTYRQNSFDTSVSTRAIPPKSRAGSDVSMPTSSLGAVQAEKQDELAQATKNRKEGVAPVAKESLSEKTQTAQTAEGVKKAANEKEAVKEKETKDTETKGKEAKEEAKETEANEKAKADAKQTPSKEAGEKPAASTAAATAAPKGAAPIAQAASAGKENAKGAAATSKDTAAAPAAGASAASKDADAQKVGATPDAAKETSPKEAAAKESATGAATDKAAKAPAPADTDGNAEEAEVPKKSRSLMGIKTSGWRSSKKKKGKK